MSAVAMEISRRWRGVGGGGREIASHGAVCRGSGRCCRFEEWGHRLYVTGVELVHFGEIENRKLKIDKASAGAGDWGAGGVFSSGGAAGVSLSDGEFVRGAGGPAFGVPGVFL